MIERPGITMDFILEALGVLDVPLGRNAVDDYSRRGLIPKPFYRSRRGRGKKNLWPLETPAEVYAGYTLLNRDYEDRHMTLRRSDIAKLRSTALYVLSMERAETATEEAIRRDIRTNIQLMSFLVDWWTLRKEGFMAITKVVTGFTNVLWADARVRLEYEDMAERMAYEVHINRSLFKAFEVEVRGVEEDRSSVLVDDLRRIMAEALKEENRGKDGNLDPRIDGLSFHAEKLLSQHERWCERVDILIRNFERGFGVKEYCSELHDYYGGDPPF